MEIIFGALASFLGSWLLWTGRECIHALITGLLLLMGGSALMIYGMMS